MIRSSWRHRPRIAGAVTRTERIVPDEITTHRRLPVHTVAHTAYTIARDRPLLDAVAWIDALLRHRGMSSGEAIDHVGRHMGERHWRVAAATLRLCDPRAESPPESYLRVHLTRGGIGPLVPQYVVRDDNGAFAGRVDLALPDCRVGIEYDGVWHADAAR